MTTRERQILAVKWALAHGLAHRVRCIDGLMRYKTDVSKPFPWKTQRSIRWRALPAWLMDRLDEGAFLVRRWWVKDVRKLRNPYEAEPADGASTRQDGTHAPPLGTQP